MDSFVLKKVTGELQELLPGSLVSKIHQPGKRELIFELWKPGGGFRLLISAHPHFNTVHITEHGMENPPAPPRFCQALRKHLSGTRVGRMELIEFERAFTLKFVRREGDGNLSTFTLVAELFGRHGNIILVDGHGIIQNALTLITKDDTTVREIIPGTPYAALPPLQKTFLPEITLETCNMIKADSWDSVTQAARRNLHGVSHEVLSQAPISETMTPRELLSAFQGLIRVYREGNYDVGITWGEGSKMALQPILNRDIISGEIREFPSAMTAADYFFHNSYSKEQFFTLKNRLLTVLGKRKKKEGKKLKNVRQDIAKLETLKEFKKKGELLKGCIHLMKRGHKEWAAMDYSQTPPRKTVIALNPSLAPVENMNRYFRLYKKGQRGIAIAAKLIPAIEEELRYLSSVEYYIREAQSLKELKSLERELIETGFMIQKQKRRVKKKGRKGKREPSPRPHVEKVTIGGYTVYLGRNNRGNDHIVKQIASPGDIWIHARNHPGSHVLIKKSQREKIPEEVIHLSGKEAAKRSGGVHAGKVEVYVADAKEVSKIPGQKPGMVRVRRYRTIMVETE